MTATGPELDPARAGWVDDGACTPAPPRPLFDDPELFQALDQQLLAELIDQRRHRARRLRIWSSACADGAEAYTLALLLRRRLPDLAEWQASVLASDHDPRWFPQPRHPLFADAALDRLPTELRALGFRRSAGARSALASSIRRLVEFGHIDLLEDTVPSLLHNAHGLDLVLCRGLLPQLADDDARLVVDKLLRALVADGCLLVDRPPPGLPAEIERKPLAGAWLLRRRPGPAPEPGPLPVLDEPVAYARALVDYRQGRYEAACRILQQASRQAARPGRLLGLLARVEAVQGRIEDARAWCELAVAADDLDPGSHCLRACILQAQGAFGEAMQAFSRALYLDPGFLLAHFGLGNLARRLGRFGEAERHYQNALALARQLPPEAALPHADGLTAGRLVAIVAALQGEVDED